MPTNETKPLTAEEREGLVARLNVLPACWITEKAQRLAASDRANAEALDAAHATLARIRAYAESIEDRVLLEILDDGC